MAERPNQKWTGDITSIPTAEGWLSLAVILDLYSRRVVGWSMSARCDELLVAMALRMALVRRRPLAGLLHHTDRGSQYTSHAYRQVLEHAGMVVSMSGKGNCYDNAATESFFGSLKEECVYRTVYQSHEQARQALFDYLEIFYNRQRRHSALGYLSPLADLSAMGNGSRTPCCVFELTDGSLLVDHAGLNCVKESEAA